MACSRCSSASSCGCAVVAGANVTVSGVGTPASPWVISSGAGVPCSLVRSCETITTLLNNGDGTYTYTNEAGATTLISAQSSGVVYDGANGSTAPPLIANNFVICSPAGGGVPGAPSQFGGQWPCADSNGTPVYQTAGGLRGVPEHYTTYADSGACFGLAFPLNAIAILPIPTMTIVSNNPSPCRNLLLGTYFGMVIQIVDPFRRGWLYQVEVSANGPGGPFTLATTDYTQASGSNIQYNWNQSIATNLIGPGATLNLSIRVSYGGFPNGGTLVAICRSGDTKGWSM